MQEQTQAVDTVETTTSAPVELTQEQLEQVGGGLTSPTAGPNDNW